MIKQDDPLFIRCANDDYPILVYPEGSKAELIEKLVVLKRGGAIWDYHEFINHMKNVLNGIVEQKCFNDSESLQYFIAMRKSMDYRVVDGRLVEEWAFDKTSPPQLQSIVVSLINFLSDSNNMKKLKKCPFCLRFFKAKDAKRKICYEDSCRKQYHKQDMKKRRESDPVKYC